MKSAQKFLSKLPEAPGVYFFKGPRGRVLYVGKATSLRDRVRSYFSADIVHTRSPLILKMLGEFVKVDFTQTDSVLEALILEANLIRKLNPPYNSKEKDNKSFNYVIFTKEDFPKIVVARGRSVSSIFPKDLIKFMFGPFPHGTQLKEAMRIIRKIFPFSDQKCVPSGVQIKNQKKEKQGRLPRACFNYQIGLCPGVCVDAVTKKEYGEIIKNLRLFFEGKKKAVLRNLEKQMRGFAREKKFEKAGEVKKTIFALNHIQDIALLKHSTADKNDMSSFGGKVASGMENFNDTIAPDKSFRIEAYDVAHLNGTNVVGVMTVVEDGELAKSQYRKFKIKINPGINDIAAHKEILRRRLEHLQWTLPNLIVLDGAQAQINAAQGVLKERGFNIDLVSVVKDEHHKAREILGEKRFIEKHSRAILLANAESHRFAIGFHRKLRRKIR